MENKVKPIKKPVIIKKEEGRHPLINISCIGII